MAAIKAALTLLFTEFGLFLIPAYDKSVSSRDGIPAMCLLKYLVLGVALIATDIGMGSWRALRGTSVNRTEVGPNPDDYIA